MNVRKIITGSFNKILQKYSMDDITVNMIIEEAEISKPTFYRYYKDKYDLLNSMYDVTMEPLKEADVTSSWDDAMIRILLEYENNIRFYQNGFKSNDLNSLRNYNLKCMKAALTEMLQRKGADVETESIYFSIVSCAITQSAAIAGWICDEHRMPKEKCVQLLKDSIPHNIFPYFTVSDI